MKTKSIFYLFFTVFFLVSCNLKSNTNSIAPAPDFKIGKQGFEKKIKEIFNFEKISFGTQTHNKLGASNTGLNLTFTVNNLNNISDEKIKKYAVIIKYETKQNLLFLEKYDYVNIAFKEEKQEGELKKSTSIKIKKELN